MGSLKNQVLGLAGGFSALFAAQQAKDSLAQYQDIRTQITALVGGQQEWIETEQYLNQVADEHNKTLDTLSGTYARLLALENGGLISHEQTIALFEGMSNAASANGASSENLGNVMYGLQQAMASGTVRAEEFNQVTEPMPDLLIKIAQAANTTVGGLREMVNSGKMSSKQFGELLVQALEQYDGAAARTADNVSAKSAEMARAYQQAVVAFEQPISDSFTVFAESSAGALTLLAENADLVTTIVGVSLTAAMGRGVVAVQAYTATKIRNLNVARETAQANLAEAQTHLKGTQAVASKLQVEIKYLEALQLSNNQKFRAIGAETQLTAARARLKVATDNMVAAQTRLNTVARAGAGVMGLLGGPVGVAMMAAGAIGYFATKAYAAQDPTKGLEEDVNRLVTEFKSLNQEGRKVLFHNLGVEASKARTALLDTQVEIRKVKQELEATSSPSMSALKQTELSKLEKKAKGLAAVVDKTNKQFKSLLETNASWQQPKDEKADDTPINAEAEDSANKMLANLQKQNALYGQTTHAAKLKYELEHGSLKGINEELAKKLMLEAQSLDAKDATKKDKKDTSAIDAFYDESDQLQTAWLQRLSIVADMENKASIEEKFAYERRKEALSQSFQEAYEQAVDDQELMNELEREHLANRELLRAEHEMNLTQISRDADEERAKQAAIVEQTSLMSYQMFVGNLSNMMGQLSTVLAASGKESESLFYATQALAMANAIINTELAASKALAYSENMTLAQALISQQAVRAIGYASVGIIAGQTIAGQAHDGINRVPRENEGTWLLKANEMVLNPTQADNFRWMVDMMQQMKAMMGAAMTASVGAPAANDNAVSVNVSGVDRSDNSSTNNVGSDLYLTLNLVEDASRAGTVEQSSDGDMTTLDIKVAKLMQSSSTQTAQVMQTRFRIQQYGS
nr:tape measure protein [Vibrio parahaemolyticus]